MPSDTFDQIDSRLLELVQRELPLVPRPFDALADILGVAPADVMERISRLKRDSVIRQISAIFDSAALGYSSALVAFRVQPEALDAVAGAVSAHTGVSHCYSRDAKYNLWFTMTLGQGHDLAHAIQALAQAVGVEAHIVLPALRVFKIGVFFDIGVFGVRSESQGMQSTKADVFGAKSEPRSILSISSIEDIASVRVLQKDLPIVDTPFAELAIEAKMTEEELLSHAENYLQTGVMRRFAAVLRHQRVGYRVNAMICWLATPNEIETAGAIFAQHPAISHCYERATSLDWPYSLYTMVHCRNEDELGRTIAELATSSSLSDYSVLRTVKEYKKSRVVYFE